MEGMFTPLYCALKSLQIDAFLHMHTLIQAEMYSETKCPFSVQIMVILSLLKPCMLQMCVVVIQR